MTKLGVDLNIGQGPADNFDLPPRPPDGPPNDGGGGASSGETGSLPAHLTDLTQQLN